MAQLIQFWRGAGGGGGLIKEGINYTWTVVINIDSGAKMDNNTILNCIYKLSVITNAIAPGARNLRIKIN